MPVVVAGALANKVGNGGEAWVRLSWVRGLQRLGHDVRFVEEVEAANDSAVAWFRRVTEAFGLAACSTLISDGRPLVGPPVGELLDVAPRSTLVNISGHLGRSELFGRFECRVLVDIDPGFTQIWHANGDPGAKVEGHDAYFTIGENIGQPDCPIPTSGLDWQPVRQPVVLDDWPVVPAAEPDRFTTVATWRGPFGPVEHHGRTYGGKVHEFRQLIELPRRAPYRFELALNIHPDEQRDIAALHDHGWRLVDPGAVAGDPSAFRSYVQGSSAEFSVAQGVYAATASGWFSDRTVRYLASGRPVLVQSTGFGRSVPTGEGVVVFSTLDEAVAGAHSIVSGYEEHALAARAIAERYFDSDVVLAGFCERAGIAA